MAFSLSSSLDDNKVLPLWNIIVEHGFDVALPDKVRQSISFRITNQRVDLAPINITSSYCFWNLQMRRDPLGQSTWT